MKRVRQPAGSRLVVGFVVLPIIAIGLMGVFGQGPEFDGWGNRLFFAVLAVLSALVAWRTAALWTEDGCLVS